MNTELQVTYHMNERIAAAVNGYAAEAEKHHATLLSRELPYTGWVGYATRFPEHEIAAIEAMATEIRNTCEVFVVIGIGGSYLGARAALDFIDGGQRKSREESAPEVVFAGFNLSGAYHSALISRIKERDICICNISKSGGTVEPGIAFAAFRELLIAKYGEAGADARTYAITDAKNGILRQEVIEKGWQSLVIPEDVGGRYSVLTPVGLLPMAVAGIDIRAVLGGAKAADIPVMANKAKHLACVRKSIQDTGKVVEVIGYYEPAAASFADWVLQLYGESEGKDGKGMLPVAAGFSKDLHSLGQFFQEGNQIFCETLLDIAEPAARLQIGPAGGDAYAGKEMQRFNEAVREGMIRAHRSIDIPITLITIPDTGAHSFGQMVAFFELTCGVTGLLMGVDPFNQPGVEAYKREMKKYLALV
jgi:glucose-6-phosphate isomerase